MRNRTKAIVIAVIGWFFIHQHPVEKRMAVDSRTLYTS